MYSKISACAFSLASRQCRAQNDLLSCEESNWQLHASPRFAGCIGFCSTCLGSDIGSDSLLLERASGTVSGPMNTFENAAKVREAENAVA